jgi:hypothetical protein
VQWSDQATHSSVLPTGKVLWWRGITSNQTQTFEWDPATGLNVESASTVPNTDLFCAGHSTLADGRLFVVGGTIDNTNDLGSPDTNIYDPQTRLWTNVSSMGYGRWYPTATTLGDGKVIVIAGTMVPGDPNANPPTSTTNATIPELYDPVLDRWTQLTNADYELSFYPFNYLLPDGKIYVLPRRRYLDIDAQTWTPGPVASYTGPQGSSAMYEPGKIIWFGGGNPAVNITEVIDFNAATPTWRVVPPMQYPRRRVDGVLLADGTVLAVGGSTAGQNNPECAVHPAELWDPATELWTTMASTQAPRVYHSTCVLLPDARVLCGGGESTSGGQANSEIFSPPYLFKGAQPVVSSAPGSVVFGDTFQISTPATGSIKGVALVRASAMTHNFDQNQRYVPLSFTDQGTYLEVTAPANGNLAPPGKYMMFIINNSGVPSVSSWVLLGSDTDGDTILDAVDPDDDNDGLTDQFEVSIGTDYLLVDSDGDNLTDYFEVNYDGDAANYTPGADLNPLRVDTDGDGSNDDVEIAANTDPLFDPSATADGDINADGVVNTADLILGYQMAMGLLTPYANQLVHGDVAPLIAGTPSPDGEINLADVLLIQRKLLGLVSF